MSTRDTAPYPERMDTEERPKLISKARAAELAGVTTRTIRRWDVAGILRCHRDPDNGRPYYEETQVLETLRDG